MKKAVKNMRIDYVLYTLAVVFFVVAVASAFFLTGTDQIIWTSTSALLGILSLSLGFIQRPKPTQASQLSTPAITMSATQPKETALEAKNEEEKLRLQTATGTEIPAILESEVAAQPAMLEAPATRPALLEAPATRAAMLEPPVKIESAVENGKPSIERALTEVSGIGEKRASQLKVLGIGSVGDLAKASVEDLAKSLKVSPKIVTKWVAGAKELQQK